MSVRGEDKPDAARSAAYLQAHELGMQFAVDSDFADSLFRIKLRISELADMMWRTATKPDLLPKHLDLANRGEFQHAMGFLHGIADALGRRSHEEGSADAGIFSAWEDETS